MVECVLCTGPSWSFLPRISLLLVVVSCWLSSGDTQLLQETVRVNVTTLKNTERITEQVIFNVSFDRGQININGFPINRGVTRMKCNMDILDYVALNEWENRTHQALVSVRLLVQDRPIDPNPEITMIVVQEEVLTIDGHQVQQNDTIQVEVVVNKEIEVIQHSTSTMALKESLLYAIPRGNDFLFTLPNIPERASDESSPQQTTREYNIRQNTTVDEEPFPGKLPETPIRAEIPASSYKVMCQIAEELRAKLCRIWTRCYPILIDLVQIVVVGVIGAAIVLEVLKIVYPSQEPKGILLSSEIKDMPMYVPLIPPNMEKTDKAQDTENIL
ncbi:glycoprotein integral membrane protein 1 [Discoglossus pictus]